MRIVYHIKLQGKSCISQKIKLDVFVNIICCWLHSCYTTKNVVCLTLRSCLNKKWASLLLLYMWRGGVRTSKLSLQSTTYLTNKSNHIGITLEPLTGLRRWRRDQKWSCRRLEVNQIPTVRMGSTAWGEPEVSYRWTGWVWELTDWRL